MICSTDDDEAVMAEYDEEDTDEVTIDVDEAGAEEADCCDGDSTGDWSDNDDGLNENFLCRVLLTF